MKDLDLKLALAELVFVSIISFELIMASIMGSEQFEGFATILLVFMILSLIRNILTSKGE